MDKKETVMRLIEESTALKQGMKAQAHTLVAIAEAMVDAFRDGRKVIIFGNGGSAAEAQHIAAELEGRFYRERDPLPAIALTANSSSLTAIGNDFGYELVFVKGVKALAKKGDVVIGISTSGNSPNVLRAIEAARQLGAVTVAFTGQSGALGKLTDYTFSVHSSDTPRIQEAHNTAGHIVCYLVEEALSGEYAPAGKNN
jgi:D-sedoheptulose 7-phosphate isomerase